MEPLAVSFRGVNKTYTHFQLADINFDLPQGQVMGFIGPNGAGKSTTLRILMGLVHQDHGKVEVLGHSMPSRKALAKWDIGFVSEDMRLYREATLAWHLQFIASIFPTWDATYADHLVRRFDLKPEQKLKGFSHGQRVKAALLLVLARRPKLLVLDEPTTGLDPVARYEVLEEMMAALVDEERSILFSSQNTHDVEQIADQITFLDQGRIIGTQDKETYLDQWRRLRVEVPSDVDLPSLPSIIQAKRNGPLAVLTTNSYSPDLISQLYDTGNIVNEVETMTLEEIFVAQVQKSRTARDV